MAAARWLGSVDMTGKLPDAQERRRGFGFLALMRVLERGAELKPRVGESRRVREDVAHLGQDPFLTFPDSDLSDLDLTRATPKVRPRFLGMFGPQGPLPISMTRDALRWWRAGDSSFVRFVDVFVARFQQLFYRSWSDARPITQFDHPSGGRFPDQLRAFTGDAGTAFADRGLVDDVVRLRYTALQKGRIRTPVKLRQIISAHFDLSVRVEEFVSSWLDFAPEDLSRMGLSGMSLGQDVKLGSRTASTGEKIIIHLECANVEEYKRFLPGRRQHDELKDLVLGYLGNFFAVEIALWLPHPLVIPAQLGATAELGWMSALTAQEDDEIYEGDMVQLCQYQVLAA
jgi:type VI secretion system protein ImpH